MEKREKISENYLERIPCHQKDLVWESGTDGETVTLFIENKGFYNRLAQKVFGRPKVSHIKLDGIGSFVWKEITGEKTILELGEMVLARYGEAAEPLYARLSMFFNILDENGLIFWK